ncbi:T9SS type A sorting domain-containing protein [Adhaeribacter soli]|uniref:T9SS type A sorting domain-containing protein n=1 Tax=Adhaeribacter soli TaxID=2607655 RepID=A0A5N1IIA4_9BACT|nr:T9SS type A sorting domain-containing protein [Adhaeribacter soli]KAA9325395.1 T9SS type A sorting domain-containing protein [Adhaeribacter soli]
MKNLYLFVKILLVLLVSFATPGLGQTLDNARIDVCNVPPGCQEEPICTLSDDCFQFDLYAPKDQGDGTSIMKLKIINFSESTFKRATFELPGKGAATKPAVRPTSKFRNRYNHDVINPFQDSLIAFDARNAGTFSYGGFEVYYYVVRNADLNAPSGRTLAVTAQAGRSWQMQRFGSVVFDIDNCVPKPPCPTTINTPCYKQDCCFGYQLIGSQVGADPGFFRPEFFLSKICAANVLSVSFSTNGATASSPLTDERTWTANATPGLLTFTNPSSPWTNVAPDSTETFIWQIPEESVTGPGATGRMVTITITTTEGAFTQTFDLLNNDPACGIAPLPVELMSFKGQQTNEGIALKWSTASEINNDRFEVERSADGRHFETIGTVRGSGNSNSRIDYTFLDKQPAKGINYYRLNQIDYDGTNAHSKVIRVGGENGKGDLGIQLIPNPCRDRNCSVEINGADSHQPLTVEIRDLTGRLVFSRDIPSDQTAFELPRLDSGGGIYILSAKNGKVTAVQKVIIH